MRVSTSNFYRILLTIIGILSTITYLIRFKRIIKPEEMMNKLADEGSRSLTYCTHLVNLYALPATQFIIRLTYGVYIRFTFTNFIVFTLKYVPTTIYIYTFIKSLYTSLRERIKQKQAELEDIQLQIQIINSKLSLRDTEFAERQKVLRRAADRLRRVRARVRNVIASDETLRCTIENFNIDNADYNLHVYYTSKEGREFMSDTLKELQCNQVAIPERLSERMQCGESPQTKSDSDDNRPYSLLNDTDIGQHCRLKIVKVTNVYKIAYLKHYIKQKRLRRANKQMLFKKKMDSVKKLLEDWHKALDMVINTKLSILNIDEHVEQTPQETINEYADSHGTSNSDTDLKNNNSDASYDKYNLSWAQDPYRPYSYNYDDISLTATAVDTSSDCDYPDYDMKYPSQFDNMYQRRNMVSIIEETNSQIAIEDIKHDADSGDSIEYKS